MKQKYLGKYNILKKKKKEGDIPVARATIISEVNLTFCTGCRGKRRRFVKRVRIRGKWRSLCGIFYQCINPSCWCYTKMSEGVDEGEKYKFVMV